MLLPDGDYRKRFTILTAWEQLDARELGCTISVLCGHVSHVVAVTASLMKVGKQLDL